MSYAKNGPKCMLKLKYLSDGDERLREKVIPVLGVHVVGDQLEEASELQLAAGQTKFSPAAVDAGVRIRGN